MQCCSTLYRLRRHNGLRSRFTTALKTSRISPLGASPKELYRRIFVNELAQVTGLEMHFAWRTQ